MYRCIMMRQSWPHEEELVAVHHVGVAPHLAPVVMIRPGHGPPGQARRHPARQRDVCLLLTDYHSVYTCQLMSLIRAW